MKDVKRKVADKRYEKQFQEYLAAAEKPRTMMYLRDGRWFRRAAAAAQGRRGRRSIRKLVAERSSLYQRISAPYISQLLAEDHTRRIRSFWKALSCDHLETYRQAANDTGERRRSSTSRMTSSSRSAVRSCEAYQRRDELNRIISRTGLRKG